MENERKLIEKAIEGDQNALRELVEKNQNTVYSVIFRQLRNQELAEELTQETFIRAYRKLATFEFRSAFSSWLVRIAMNVTFNYLDSRAAWISKLSDSYDEGTHARADESSAEELLSHERKSLALRDCMQKLADKYREVVALCSFEKCSYQRASEILEIPVGTVASRMNMAYRLLRECVAKRIAHE